MGASKPVSLNLNVRGLGLSATLAINEKCAALRSEGREIFRFGLGQSPFPVPTPVVEALRLAAPEKDYLPVRGLRALREAVADFHRRSDGIDAHHDRVLVGPGSKELMFLLQIAFYGEILLPTPCWVSYFPQAQIIGRRVSQIHTRAEDEWRLTAAQLEEGIADTQDDHRPRILVLNYPGNPSGTTYSATELRELATVAKKYGVVVLSDEIYGQTNHRGEHVSIARFYPEGTIISSGLSKWCGAGGWRLGTFVFPPDLDWLLDAMAAIASESYTSVSAPIQYAAVTAFHLGVEIERYLWHTRRILRELGGRITSTLHTGGVRVRPPEGAFYLWLDFSERADTLRARGIETSTRLCRRLLDETGVAILPGAGFGRDPHELTARLAYVDFDGSKALAASENIALDTNLPEGFVDHWCGNVISGVQRLVAWLDQESA